MLPSLVVVGAGAAAHAARQVEVGREIENAGRVLNGRRLPGSVADAIAAQLDRRRPEVVVLGNSNANTDIDEAVLAAALGIPRERVVVLSIPNSIGAHWYALLKNHVFGRGHRPARVLVVSRLQLALLAEPLSEAGHVNLDALLADDEPVVERKTGRPPAWLRTLRQDRASLRDTLIHGARDLAIAAMPSSIRPERPRKALDRVFADEALDPDRRPTVAPVALPSVAESYLPDLAALAEEHGAELVLVRPPWSPNAHHHEADVVPPGAAGDVARTVRLLDLTGLTLDPADFANPTHLDDAAATRFTAAVVGGLAALRTPPGDGLLGTIEVVDGRWARPEPAIEPLAAPPAIRAAVEVRDDVGHVPLPDAAFLADAAVLGRHPLAARCSPLRVLRDGAPLPANRPCHEVQKRAASCHDERGLWFGVRDEATWTVALAEDRRCDGAAWLYPGDAWRGTWPEPVSASKGLLLVGSPLGVGEGELRLRLVVDGAPRDLPPLPLGALAQAAAVPLVPPIPDGASITLEVANPTSAFVLVTRAELIP